MFSAAATAGCVRSNLDFIVCWPTEPGTYTITATSTVDRQKAATATLKVIPNIIISDEKPILGNDSAKVIMLGFMDYRCPYGAQYVRETFPAIKEQYIDTGKIRYAVIDFPFMGQISEKAAQASRCGGDQGKYWEIHELMMHNQNSLGDLDFFVEALDLDVMAFRSCLDTEKYRDSVKADYDLSSELVFGVPNFIIGTTDPGHPRTVHIIPTPAIGGALPFDTFRQYLDAAIIREP